MRTRHMTTAQHHRLLSIFITCAVVYLCCILIYCSYWIFWKPYSPFFLSQQLKMYVPLVLAEKQYKCNDSLLDILVF